MVFNCVIRVCWCPLCLFKPHVYFLWSGDKNVDLYGRVKLFMPSFPQPSAAPLTCQLCVLQNGMHYVIKREKIPYEVKWLTTRPEVVCYTAVFRVVTQRSSPLTCSWISKYHLWYLCQISLQITLLPILIILGKAKLQNSRPLFCISLNNKSAYCVQYPW